MPNYQNGKIYKISNDIDDDIYIGSTTLSLKQRLHLHCSDAKRNKGAKLLIPKILNLGSEHFKIELLCLYACESLHALLEEEQRQIDIHKPTLNYAKSFGRDAEKQKKNRIKYVDQNREQLNLKRKEHRLMHLDSEKQRCNTYKEKNKEYLAEKIVCECGVEFRRSNKSYHEKSKKHKNFYIV